MRAIFQTSIAMAALTLIAGCSEAPQDGAIQSGPDATRSAAASIAPAIYTYEDAMSEVKARVEAAMAGTVDVPMPKDAGGGYTHERHKLNAKLIYEAGALYEQTGDKKYARFGADLLLRYADMYPGLGLHPEQKEQSPGRLFWQNLNESWWLVYAIQGYDKFQDALPQDEQTRIEDNVLLAISDFLSNGSPETFNKVHNHGTWATAAVGMTGYALDRPDLVEQALLGLDLSGEGGFLIQLDRLFSPDGYYNEGPYYQRFALMPFVLFGQAIEKNEPERKIFEHRDGILKKAIYTTIQQSYGGLFFPINDAIKDKGIATQELQYGVAIAYDLTGDKTLLSIAQEQGGFVPTPEGRALSRDIQAGLTQPFEYATMRLSDGQNGDEGALDVLRSSSAPNSLTLVMKNTSQGLGHGHFDKMGFNLYHQGHEILSDYGAARFLNVEAKYGGHYLPENNAFAKQTIAHNALVIDRQSHFGGVTEEGNKHHPVVAPLMITDTLKASSATIDTAYPGVTMTRTMAMITDPALKGEVIIDVMEASSETAHDYDLPFYYNAQFISSNLDITANDTARKPLGTDNGYQYLWDVARGAVNNGLSQVTLLKDRTFYSLTSALPSNSQVVFAEVGANDPNFNLRREHAMILRASGQQGVRFVTVIEPHGEYNPTLEYTKDSYSAIDSVEHAETDGARAVLLTLVGGAQIGLGFAPQSDAEATQSIVVGDHTLSWSGPYALFSSQQLK